MPKRKKAKPAEADLPGQAKTRPRRIREAGECEPVSEAHTLQLLHELQVRQIELEMQNEALQKAQEEIAQGLARYSDLYDFAPVGYLTLNSKGLIIEANLTVATMLGRPRSCMVGKRFEVLLSVASTFAVLKFLDTLWQHRATGSGEAVLLVNAEEPLHVRITGRVLEFGQVSECRLALTDISESKRAEQEIIRSNAELEQRVLARTSELADSNQELESFAYSVSHDLRAPLRAIDGFSLTLLEDFGAQLDEAGRHYLTRIRANAQRMGELIDDIQKLSRLTRVAMTCAPVDLSALAQELVTNLSATEPQRAVEWSITRGLVAYGDSGLLKLALENLLNNAFKFTSKIPVAHIQFGATEEDGHHVFFVRDNGDGFDINNAGKLFTPFQRFHTAEEFEGQGIGLATVRRIVHRHCGRIWADSVPRKGTTIYFTLGTETTPPERPRRP